MAYLRRLVRSRLVLTTLTAGALLLVGCSTVLIRRAESLLNEELRPRRDPAEELLPEVARLLQQRGLAEVYRRSPAEVRERLQEAAAVDPLPDVLLALADVSRALARRAEKEPAGDAAADHHLCAGYAYHFLLKGPGSEVLTTSIAPDEIDVRVRRGRQLYNEGLAGWLRATGYVGRKETPPDKPVPAVPMVRHGFGWKADEFGPLLFAPVSEGANDPEAQRRWGLGVPLVCLRSGEAAEAGGGGVRFFPGWSFAATAFLRFDGGLADLAAGRLGQLELYNPLAACSVEMGGRVFPLEIDLDSPLAHFRRHTDLGTAGDLGFLHPDRLRERRGIYLAEPYQPGKVLVLFVHGLRSSPATWLALFRELHADPRLREGCQFGFYFYPSGDMYLKAAADLRRDLARLREEVDPQRRDAAFDRMVIVGHSMGGLIGRLLTIDSGDEFWRAVAARPLDSLRVSAEAEADLRRLFHFERQTCIRRVVFLATPHQGSKLSASLPAKLTGQFGQPPRLLHEAARELLRSNPGLDASMVQRIVPTGEQLGPGAPFLIALAAQPRPRDVAYHSIIGVAPLHSTILERTIAASSWQEKSDGVVPYSSARLGDVESEITVPVDHSHMKHHPRTIAEVRRILREHVESRE